MYQSAIRRHVPFRNPENVHFSDLGANHFGKKVRNLQELISQSFLDESDDSSQFAETNSTLEQSDNDVDIIPVSSGQEGTFLR